MRTIAEWYGGAGPLMPVLVVVALLGITVVGERVYAIVIVARANGRAFIERSIQLVRGGKLDDAIKQCTAARTSLADVGLLLLRSRSNDEAELRDIADAAVLLLVPRLRRRLRYLPMLAGLAGAAGVIGLSIGLERALSAAGAPSAVDRGEAFATLAALAVRPLTASLVVTSVLVASHAYLASQADIITDQIHEYAARLISALIDRADVRLGHR